MQVEFILQRNRETRALWERLEQQPPPNLSFLFDESMGLGTIAAAWPAPPDGQRFGYAGGLSPLNISEQLQLMAEVAAGCTFWVDMESGVRSQRSDGTDDFDINKVGRVIDRVIELGFKPG